MKQEPVAWLYERIIKEPDCYKHIKGITRNSHDLKRDDKIEPLYTEPQYRELSDEEMYKLAEECGFNVDENGAINDGVETAADFHEQMFNFARAILKKASE